MRNKQILLVLSAAVILAGAMYTPAQTVPPKQEEGKLIAVLKSADATRKDKHDACRQLALIGTKAAVPVLASLLGDEEMSHMARYALEPIPDPAVDAALREALGTVKGKPLVGVIGSVGVRADAGAVPQVAGMLKNSDPLVAQAAARALGGIGTPEAVKALEGALPGTSGDMKLCICEGLLRAAEGFVAAGKNPDAVAIYDRLRKLDDPHQVRSGGVRGAILARGPAGVALINEYIKSSDYILFSAAIRASSEMPGEAVTKALADGMKGLSTDHQLVVLGTLAVRRDATAMPQIAEAAASGDKAVRLAAMKAMPAIGDASAAPILLDLLNDSDRDIANAAQENLAAMEGPKVDAAVLAMLDSGQTARQLKGLEMIERRRMTNVTAALMKATADDDEAVRSAAIRLLGSTAGADEFPVLVKLLLNAESASEIRSAEQALSGVCSRQAQPAAGGLVIHKAVYGAADGRSADVTAKVAELVKSGQLSITASNANFGDPAEGTVKQLTVDYTAGGVRQTATVAEGETLTPAAAVTPKPLLDQLVAALDKAQTPQKAALLRVLRSTKTPQALDAVRSAARGEGAIADEAVSMLCDWPTAEALPDVLKMAQTATDERVKVLALRGAIRMIPLQNISEQDKLAGLKKLLPMVQRNQDKQLLLGALGNIASADALAMIMSYMDDPATKNEACFAAVAVAERIAETDKAAVTEAMQTVIKTTTNQALTRRARQVLNKARN